MGSGLCRRTDEGRPRAKGVDGLYQKIVFNYAKQLKRYSDKHPKVRGKNTKRNKSKKSKPIISGPFPVDPERLQGEKWRYVILTRLDTEQPPERPPRAKRHSNGQLWPKTTFGRWGSSQRRSFGRSSRDRPPRPIRRRTVAAAANDTKRLSAAQLLELMFRVYTRRPIAISLPSPSAKRQLAGKAKQMDRPSLVAAPVEKSCPPPAGVPTKGVDKASRPNKVVKKSKPSVLPPVPVKTDRSNGFIQSVDRIKAMANNLLL